jgi:hypothetical protein
MYKEGYLQHPPGHAVVRRFSIVVLSRVYIDLIPVLSAHCTTVGYTSQTATTPRTLEITLYSQKVYESFGMLPAPFGGMFSLLGPCCRNGQVFSLLSAFIPVSPHLTSVALFRHPLRLTDLEGTPLPFPHRFPVLPLSSTSLLLSSEVFLDEFLFGVCYLCI